jgi:ribose-phosphate pyrophosphokinase
MADEFLIFAGTANRPLAEEISQVIGVQLSAAEVKQFPDGEISVELQETVRRKEVFIVQPTSPPVNDNLMELLAFADTCRRAAAYRVTAIIPYFGYGRADKRRGRREPITASMVAHLLRAVSVDHVVLVDPHTAQIEGFFHAAVDSITAVPTLCRVLRPRLAPGTVVVSPDAGRVKMATRYATHLNTSLVVLHKQRESGTRTEVTHLVGDVRDRSCLIVDDMISTGGTIASSIQTLLKAGARPEITVAATHGLFVGDARRKLVHEAIREVVVSNSIRQDGNDWLKLQVVSIAPVIATIIERFMIHGSIEDVM